MDVMTIFFMDESTLLGDKLPHSSVAVVLLRSIQIYGPQWLLAGLETDEAECPCSSYLLSYPTLERPQRHSYTPCKMKPYFTIMISWSDREPCELGLYLTSDSRLNI